MLQWSGNCSTFGQRLWEHAEGWKDKDTTNTHNVQLCHFMLASEDIYTQIRNTHSISIEDSQPIQSAVDKCIGNYLLMSWKCRTAMVMNKQQNDPTSPYHSWISEQEQSNSCKVALHTHFVQNNSQTHYCLCVPFFEKLLCFVVKIIVVVLSNFSMNSIRI